MRTFEISLSVKGEHLSAREAKMPLVSNEVLGSEIDEFGRREVARLRRIQRG